MVGGSRSLHQSRVTFPSRGSGLFLTSSVCVSACSHCADACSRVSPFLRGPFGSRVCLPPPPPMAAASCGGVRSLRACSPPMPNHLGDSLARSRSWRIFLTPVGSNQRGRDRLDDPTMAVYCSWRFGSGRPRPLARLAAEPLPGFLELTAPSRRESAPAGLGPVIFQGGVRVAPLRRPAARRRPARPQVPPSIGPSSMRAAVRHHLMPVQLADGRGVRFA